MNPYQITDALCELPRNLAYLRARIATLEALSRSPRQSSDIALRPTEQAELTSLRSQWLALAQMTSHTRRVSPLAMRIVAGC
jgi:hypothetical protein